MNTPKNLLFSQIPVTTELFKPEALEKPFPNNSTLKTWNPLNAKFKSVTKNHVKYEQRLVKPLQVTQNRYVKTENMLKQLDQYIEVTKKPQEDQTYSEIRTKVKQINGISKIHRTLVTKSVNRSRVIKEEDDQILRETLNETTYQRVKQIRAISQDLNSLQSSKSVADLRENSLENENKQQDRHQRIAAHLSCAENKKLPPKQLNSNPRFRHAKRKVLLLRTFESATNYQDTLQEIFSKIDGSKESSKDSNDTIVTEPSEMSRSTNNFRPQTPSKHRTQTPSNFSKKIVSGGNMRSRPNENVKQVFTDFFGSTTSVNELADQARNTQKDSETIYTTHIFQNTDSGFNNYDDMCESRVMTTHKSTDNLYNTSLNFIKDGNNEDTVKVAGKDKVYGVTMNNFMNRDYMPVPMTLNYLLKDSRGNSKNNSRNQVRTESHERSEDSRGDISMKRIRREKSSFTVLEKREPLESKMLTELRLNLLEDNKQAKERVPKQNIKRMQTTKAFKSLKHIRNTPSMFQKSYEHLDRGTDTNCRASVKSTKRGPAGDFSKGVYKAIQGLIEKSYQETPSVEHGNLNTMDALLKR